MYIRRTLSNCAPFYSAGGHQNIGPGGVIIVEETFSSSSCIGRHLLWPFTSGKSKGYSMNTWSEWKKKSSDDDGP